MKLLFVCLFTILTLSCNTTYLAKPFAEGARCSDTLECCIESILQNQKLVAESGLKCTVYRTVNQSNDSGVTKRKLNALTHRFERLPHNQDEFIFVLYPRFSSRDTFSLISNTQGSMTISVSSADPIFQYYIEDCKIILDQADFQIKTIDATIKLHSKRKDKNSDLLKSFIIRAPLRIDFRLRNGLCMPSFCTYMHRIGGPNDFPKPVWKMDEMHYSYGRL